MKIKLGLAALVFASFLASTACAQSPTRLVSLVGSTSPSEFEKRVMAALSARISATTRYTISSASDA
jgi:hypothetical protein